VTSTDTSRAFLQNCSCFVAGMGVDTILKEFEMPISQEEAMPSLQAVLAVCFPPSLVPGNRKVGQHVLNPHDDVKL
jgi:hypothetical protein